MIGETPSTEGGMLVLFSFSFSFSLFLSLSLTQFHVGLLIPLGLWPCTPPCQTCCGRPATKPLTACLSQDRRESQCLWTSDKHSNNSVSRLVSTYMYRVAPSYAYGTPFYYPKEEARVRKPSQISPCHDIFISTSLFLSLAFVL